MIRIPPAAEQLAVLERGIVDLNVRDELVAKLEHSHKTQTPLKIKAGFDPTAPDLHLGHMVLIEKMAQYQRFGHEVIFIVGDYTALIGDPTGRNAMRPALSEEEIKKNAATYTEQVFKALDRNKTRIEWNSTWLGKLTFAEVIKLASRYNVARMLERKDFKDRFEKGVQIAVHEFLYPLMQGYDSVALNDDVELGGHDQIFNLNVGRDLMSSYGQKPQVVMTVPLLVGLDGKDKMSKSKGNHIGITEPPEDMFGKTMSIDDATMLKWYELLTDEYPTVSNAVDDKKFLAHLLVARFHGLATADAVLDWWNAGRPPRNVAEVEVPAGPLYAVLTASGLATGGNDARRKITQGGVTVDGRKAENPTEPVAPGSYLLTVGKKAVKKVKVV